jgi:MFS family permease
MTARPDTTSSSSAIRSLIPARIDRLPWSRFHTRLVTALGVAWILDGLEITIASNVSPDLTEKATLHMSTGGAADIATWYLIGEVIGALFFGRLSDKLGRKNLFMVTLGVYLVGSGLTAATPAGGKWFIFLYFTRIVAGMGIGGEYAAINSAIDEMIPAKYRGPGRSRGQRHLLGRSHPGHPRHARSPEPFLGRPGQAAGLPARPGAGAGHHLRPQEPAGKPPLADHARPGTWPAPLTIGRLFDMIGRKKMISGTYLLSGVMLIISAQLFKAGDLNATTQTLAWVVIFFFASAGASAGYLTVSEVFPLEVRAKASPAA